MCAVFTKKKQAIQKVIQINAKYRLSTKSSNDTYLANLFSVLLNFCVTIS